MVYGGLVDGTGRPSADAVRTYRRSEWGSSRHVQGPAVGFPSPDRVHPRKGVSHPGRSAQELHFNPRQLLLLPMGRLREHRHSTLQGEFSGESSGAGLPAIPRAYRCHHGIHYKGWAFLGHSPSIWWPEDRAWCVATDIDLFDTYVGGSGRVHRGGPKQPGPGGVTYNSRRST